MHERLKQVREAAGLSYHELCKKTGVQGHQIKLYEAGQKDFMANTLKKLFEACGYTLVIGKLPPILQGEGEE